MSEQWFLVLDGNEMVARLIARALAPLGRPCIAATCAAARRALASPAHLAAAVLDLEPPDGSALDVLAELRLIRPGLPVLVVSANAEHEAVNQVQRLGAEFAYKPFRAANLLAFGARAGGAQWAASRGGDCP